MLVQPGTLPKTSSGKLQRAKCRELYLEEHARAGDVMRVFASTAIACTTRARDRVVRRAAAVRAPRSGPRRSARRWPPTSAFDDRRAAASGTARSRPSTIPGSSGSSSRRGRSTSATWAGARRRTRRVRHAGAAGRDGRLGRAVAGRRPPRLVVLRDDDAADRRHLRAARSAVDCALATADAVLGGEPSPTGCAGRPGTRDRRCTAATASSTTRRSPPPTCRGDRRARSPCSTSTTTTATAPADLLRARRRAFVSLHGDPVRAYPYHTGFADETGAGRGAGAPATCRCPPAPTTTPTSRASTRRSAAVDAVRPGASSSSRSASTPTSATRCATSASPPTASPLRPAVAALGRPLVVLQEGGYADDALGANVRAWLLGALTGRP